MDEVPTIFPKSPAKFRVDVQVRLTDKEWRFRRKEIEVKTEWTQRCQHLAVLSGLDFDDKTARIARIKGGYYLHAALQIQTGLTHALAIERFFEALNALQSDISSFKTEVLIGLTDSPE